MCIPLYIYDLRAPDLQYMSCDVRDKFRRVTRFLAHDKRGTHIVVRGLGTERRAVCFGARRGAR